MFINSSTHSIYCLPGLADTGNTSGKVMPGLWKEGTSIDSMHPLEVPTRGCLYQLNKLRKLILIIT